MMDINEAMEDADASPDAKAKLLLQIEILEAELYKPVKNIIENYSEGVTTKEAMLQVKEYYFKKKYLQRLLSQSVQKL